MSIVQRVGDSAERILIAQSNLATTYKTVGRFEHSLHIQRIVYSKRVELYGEEQLETLRAAFNYATSFLPLRRFEEARSLLRRTMPVARRALGESNETALRMRGVYAVAFYEDPTATLDGLREAVATLEDAERIARRVFGGAHPLTKGIEGDLRQARAALRAREASNA